jgi:hypothetical protein
MARPCYLHGCVWCTCPPPVDFDEVRRKAQAKADAFFATPEGQAARARLREAIEKINQRRAGTAEEPEKP